MFDTSCDKSLSLPRKRKITMPSTAQIQRWRTQRADGRSLRYIADQSGVAPSTVHRALALPPPSIERARPLVDIALLARLRGIIANVQSIHAPSAASLRNIHRDMLATDATRIIKETKRDVLKALGY